MSQSNIKDFYNGKNIFITGGTGFVGIALVEKLLRTTELNKIFLLMRPKKGKEISARLEEYKKNPIFKRLIEEQGDSSLNKIVPVAGDISDPELGLSSDDVELLVENVNVVFHSAATLDFDACLKSTVQINLLGTRRVVELCKKLRHLTALLHVSSAYVNSHLLDVEEKYYPVHETADNVIKLVENSTESELEEKTPEILGKYINTYTFTKALAEIEVTIDTIPSCIVRPSIIVAAWKEPYEGWTISKNGPQGFIMGASKGVVRRLPLDQHLIADYVPVDIVINGMLVGAYHAGTTRPTETPVFHLTTSTCKPFRWSLVTPHMHSLLHRYPLKSAVWYPCLKPIPSLFLFKLSAIIFHWLPAIILDSVAKFTGGRPILMRMHTNIANSLDRLKPFIFTEWRFDNKKALALHNSLSNNDREIFNLDVATLDWEEYFDNMAKGVRIYLHNDPLSTLEKAKKKDQMLRWLNLVIQFVFTGFVWFAFALLTGSTYRGTLFVVPAVLFLISIL